jgi:hypothetical protein
MKNLYTAVVVICFLAIGENGLSQASKAKQVTWKDLAEVTFKEEYNKEYDFKVLIPRFSKNVKALDGKWIKIEGYAIPVDEVGFEDMLVLSGVPYSQCFFCGLSGPESVMDIKPKKKLKGVKTDKKLKLVGKLKLNERDLSKLNYILTEAELVE